MAYASQHNGGILQVNAQGGGNGMGTWPLANLALGFQTFTGNSNLWLDANKFTSLGYPTTAADGYGTITFLPKQSERPGDYVLTWSGRAEWVIQHDTGMPTIGSLNNMSAGGVGRFQFRPQNDDSGRIVFYLANMGSPGPSDLKLFHVDDEDLLPNGLGRQFEQRIRDLNFGWIRFLAWQQTNTCNVHLASQLQPKDHIPMWDTYAVPELWAGSTTNSGSDYTMPAIGAPVGHGDARHVRFNETNPAQLFFCTLSVANPMVVTTRATNAIDGTPVAHGATVGEIWGFGTDQAGGGQGSTNVPQGNLYVITATPTPETFRCKPIAPGSVEIDNSTDDDIPGKQSTKVTCFKVARLREGSSGTYYPILNEYGNPAEPGWTGPMAGQVGTVIFDDQCKVWVKYGSTRWNLGFAGDRYFSGMPHIDYMLELCATLGAHPHICIPPNSLFPIATDLAPTLLAYIKNWIITNGVLWMRPRLEPGNEIWNGHFGFEVTNCLTAKARIARGGWAIHDIYGEMLSKLGQIAHNVWGGDRSKYDIVCAVQTASNASDSAPRMTSARYVAEGPTQAGYSRTPASAWTTHICPTEYVTTAAYGNQLEFDLQASLLAGDLTAADKYVDTLATGGPFTIDSVIALHVAWKAFAISHGVYKMCGYEGSYSPDYNGTNKEIRLAGKSAVKGDVYRAGIHHAMQSLYDGIMALQDDSFTVEGLSVFIFAGNYPSESVWAFQENVFREKSPMSICYENFNRGKRRYTVNAKV